MPAAEKKFYCSKTIVKKIKRGYYIYSGINTHTKRRHKMRKLRKMKFAGALLLTAVCLLLTPLSAAADIEGGGYALPEEAEPVIVNGPLSEPDGDRSDADTTVETQETSDAESVEGASEPRAVGTSGSGVPQFTTADFDCGSIDSINFFPCESRNGLYILVETGNYSLREGYHHKELKLYLFSFSDNKLSYVTSLWQNEPSSKTGSFVQYTGPTYYTAGSKIYLLGRDASGLCLQAYDLDTQKTGKKTYLKLDAKMYLRAYGVDAAGRIYAADGDKGENGYPMYLLSSDGKILSQTVTDKVVYRFSGFDSTNGNFYFEGYTNWIYWGYEHDCMVLYPGTVNGNAIEVSNRYMALLSQHYNNESFIQAELVRDRYLLMQSALYSRFYLMDSNARTFAQAEYSSDVPEEADAFSRYVGNEWRSCIGVRAYINEERDSLIYYVDNNVIREISLSDYSAVCEAKTLHPVYYMTQYEDYALAVEEENNVYYIERFLWKNADKIEFTAGEVTVRVGESVQVTAETNTGILEKLVWTSGDSTIASVTERGEIIGWHPGETTVTVTLPSGISASVHVSVVGEIAPRPEPDTELTGYAGTDYSEINADKGSYQTYGSTVRSGLYEDGKYLVRVEAHANDVLVEKYTDFGKTLKTTKKIKKELDLFGGFFSGAENNYLVFGRQNQNESDETEVLRVVKYDKNWKRLAAISIKGENTYIPFDAGSLRMDEAGGKLYIHTCHEMYQTEDGLHHQANMTFVIDEQNMTVADSYSDIMNIAQAGYVSHSFNQFVKTDDRYVYRVDHGDYAPRAVTITKAELSGDIEDVTYTYAFLFSNEEGSNYNYTGASVGGFELSRNNCLVAGNEDIVSSFYDARRNVFVSIVSKDLESRKTIWFTDFTSDSAETAHTPQLVKIGEQQFLLMWDEYNVSTGQFVRSRAVAIDEDGNKTSAIVSSNLYKLSDCQPVLCSDGNVRWYVTDYDKPPVVFAMNPYRLMNVIRFKDVMDKNSWYYNAVYWAVENGVTSGYGEGTFQPMKDISRAQAVAFLYKLAGQPDVDALPEVNFSDVRSTDWYYRAVRWAVARGITTGYGEGTFRPNVTCNRAMIVTFLMKYAMLEGKYAEPDKPAVFSDVPEKIWYRGAVDWAVASGVTAGYGEGTFQPMKTCNRAMMVTFLKKVAELPKVE